MKIAFTVPGVCVPYLRMTQGQARLMKIPDHRLGQETRKVKERIARYLHYKKSVFVLSCLLNIDRAPQEKVFLNVKIYFNSKKHGDPENVRKGIQDAIFAQDKMVAGGVDFFYDYENPRVEIEIIQGLTAG